MCVLIKDICPLGDSSEIVQDPAVDILKYAPMVLQYAPAALCVYMFLSPIPMHSDLRF